VHILWNVQDQAITVISVVTGSLVTSFNKNLVDLPGERSSGCLPANGHCFQQRDVTALRAVRTQQQPNFANTGFVYGQLRERRLGESLVRASARYIRCMSELVRICGERGLVVHVAQLCASCTTCANEAHG
jgi:hypothetical protein